MKTSNLIKVILTYKIVSIIIGIILTFIFFMVLTACTQANADTWIKTHIQKEKTELNVFYADGHFMSGNYLVFIGDNQNQLFWIDKTGIYYKFKKIGESHEIMKYMGNKDEK